jgi:hypothetical protein
VPAGAFLDPDGSLVHASDDGFDIADPRVRMNLEAFLDNFLIRSQIWAAEHLERFWPVVDREWQERQLIADGYGKPLP